MNLFNNSGWPGLEKSHTLTAINNRFGAQFMIYEGIEYLVVTSLDEHYTLSVVAGKISCLGPNLHPGRV